MPRGKKGDAEKSERPNGFYPTPDVEYVCSPEPVSLETLSKRWAGLKGCTVGNLMRRSRKENWVKRRKSYQAKVHEDVERRLLDRQSEERSRQIEEASKRHADIGKEMQQLGRGFGKTAAVLLTGKVRCPHCGENVEVPAPEMKPGDAGRTYARLGKDGVETERKALGIAEKYEVLYQAETYVAFVYQILEKHVMQFPDIFRAMSEDLARFHEVESSKVRAEIGPVIDVPGKKGS